MALLQNGVAVNKDMDALNQKLEERLQTGNVALIIPQGISMLPFIRGGVDRVMLRKQQQVGVGDVVLVKYGDHMILHRVYAIEGATLVLMGDGNLKGNERVKREEVLGTALEVIRPDGRSRKLGKAWLWRHTLPVRRYLLKLHRKWNKLMKK